MKHVPTIDAFPEGIYNGEVIAGAATNHQIKWTPIADLNSKKKGQWAMCQSEILLTEQQALELQLLTLYFFYKNMD